MTNKADRCMGEQVKEIFANTFINGAISSIGLHTIQLSKNVFILFKAKPKRRQQQQQHLRVQL